MYIGIVTSPTGAVLNAISLTCCKHEHHARTTSIEMMLPCACVHRHGAVTHGCNVQQHAALATHAKINIVVHIGFRRDATTHKCNVHSKATHSLQVSPLHQSSHHHDDSVMYMCALTCCHCALMCFSTHCHPHACSVNTRLQQITSRWPCDAHMCLTWRHTSQMQFPTQSHPNLSSVGNAPKQPTPRWH